MKAATQPPGAALIVVFDEWESRGAFNMYIDGRFRRRATQPLRTFRHPTMRAGYFVYLET